MLDELVRRTPGYASWQQEEWRTHCGPPCAYRRPFAGRVLLERRDEVAADLEAAGIPLDWLADYPEEPDPGGGVLDPGLHLFECIVCGRARATGYYS